MSYHSYGVPPPHYDQYYTSAQYRTFTVDGYGEYVSPNPYSEAMPKATRARKSSYTPAGGGYYSSATYSSPYYVTPSTKEQTGARRKSPYASSRHDYGVKRERRSSMGRPAGYSADGTSYYGKYSVYEEPRNGRSKTPALPRTRRQTKEADAAPRRSNTKDAKAAGIPAGYSIKSWDSLEEPITLLEFLRLHQRPKQSKVLTKALLEKDVSRQRSRSHKVLPVTLAGQRFEALADTGADENAMSLETANLLGLDVRLHDTQCQEFMLPNGQKFSSVGKAEVDCGFAEDQVQTTYKVAFNVFEDLAVSVIIGKEFLDVTKTLTQHTHRLVKQSDGQNPSMLRVLHMNRPTQRMQCIVDDKVVYANADTGAQMNLMSADFAGQQFHAHMLKKESLLVQFADKSVHRVEQSVVTRYSPRGDTASRGSILTKFYILDGLTSDVLIGEDLLYETEAFTKHSESFFDVGIEPPYSSINLITWLKKREQRLSEQSNNGSTPSPAQRPADPPGQDLPDPALQERLFRRVLQEADMRELHRRETEENRIANLRQDQQGQARDVETALADQYKQLRAECMRLHLNRVGGTSVAQGART